MLIQDQWGRVALGLGKQLRSSNQTNDMGNKPGR